MATTNVIWILSLSIVVTGKTPLPDGDFHREDACAGADLRLSCGTAESIIVQDVQFGTKPTQICSQSDTSAGCCSYAETDCFLPFDSNVIGESCSGRILCNPGQIAATDSSSCNHDTASQYPGVSHYLTTEVKCVPDARINQSSSASLKDTGKLLYLQNTGYPSKVRSTETYSVCSVETRSCSSKIKVYFVHFKLADASGQCPGKQQMRIEDRDIIRTYTCSNNTNFVITPAFTSSSNYLKIEFKNPNGVNDGYFWIGFEETEISALLTLDCPGVPQTICMDCPPLSNITYGTVSTDGGRSTGQNATYRCYLGYRLTGDSVRTCQENGTWDNQEPICQIKDCPVLSNPDNGNVSTPEGRTYGETAIYSCQYGYHLDGISSRVCGANGNWNGTETNCVQTVCPALSNPDNGSVTVGVSPTVDQTANYTCDHKFRIDGDAVRVCQNNATWSSDAPVCFLIFCPNVTAPVNGSVTLTGLTLGETATYSCGHGHTLSGEVERTCGHDGTWSGSDPVCQLTTCDPLPKPANGNVSSEGLAIGQIATYTCSVGYILIGGETRTCRNDYTWSGAEPVCKLRDDGLSDTVIIIIAVAAGVILIAIIAIVVLVCRKRNKADNRTDDAPNRHTEKGQAYNNNAYNGIPISGETWIITNQTQPTTAVAQSTEMTSFQSEEHKEEDKIISPRDTENVINEVKEKEYQAADNQAIQQPDADQSDKSVIHKSDINMDMAEDVKEVGVTSSEPKEVSDNPLTDSVIQEAKPDPEEEPDLKTKTECTPLEEKTGGTELGGAAADPQMATNELEAIEKEIKEADMSINLDTASPQVSDSIKDLAAALFRSASIAKRNLIARGRSGDHRFEFETTEDSEWSKGLLAAAKDVMAAIYNLCNISNDLAEGKTTDEMLEAAAQEIRRATTALIVAYRVEGDLESSTLKELNEACIAVGKFADSLVKSTVNQSDNKSADRKSVTLDGGEVQKSKRLIEAQATVIRKEKELSEALKTKAELNQQLNKFDKDEEPEISTEL